MKSFGATNIGKVRFKNDDSFYVLDGKKGIYIVADGMGGYKGGQLASKIAVRSAVETLKNYSVIDEDVAKKVVDDVQEKLRHEIEQNQSLQDMGTTITACLSSGNSLSCLHIGDSRAYQIKSGHIYQLTEDHTLVNVLYKNGVIKKEDMRRHPKRNVLMRSLGANDTVVADLFSVHMDEGDYLLLCSDGLTDPLTKEMILEIFQQHDDPKIIGEALVADALRLGGSDNIAVVVIKG